MCTTIAKKIDSSWYLSKTRDPVPWMRWDDEIKLFDSKIDKYKKLIIQNPNPQEDGYYGGINEKGVVFISTFVPVAENQVSYIRRPYIRLILDASTAKEAIKIIRSFNPRIGGNMFIADDNECYGIESNPDKYYVENINESGIKTNHYIHLPDRNLTFNTDPTFEEWSNNHYDRAKEMLATTNNVEDLKKILRDRKNAKKKTAICTTKNEDECFTHSAFIFDVKNRKVLYSQGNPLENEFKEYSFN